VVTVEAQKQRKLIERQISRLCHRSHCPARKSRSGWKPPICFLVSGLPRAQGEFLLARLSQVAKASTAPLAPEACKPNFLVVMTTAPEQLLENW
jgi:hypothetical protein